MHDVRDADATWFGQSLQASGHVDAIAVDVTSLNNDIAEINTDTQLDLRTGRIFGTVKKLSGGSRYEIKIPNGVAGVRGTIFSLSHLGNLAVWKEGAMALALAVGDEITRVVVEANMKYDAPSDTLSPIDDSTGKEMRSNAQAASGTSQPTDPFPSEGDRPADDPVLLNDTGFISDNMGGSE